MATVEDILNNIVYHYRERVLAVLRVFTAVNVVLAISFLIYWYGFILDYEESINAIELFDIVFVIVSVAFFTRMVMALKRREYIKNNLFEFILVTAIIIHALFSYLFDYVFITHFMMAMGSDSPELSYQHVVSVFVLILVGIELTKISTRLSDVEVKPATSFIISFILLIGVGAALLMLPAMTLGNDELAPEDSMPFIDALFTSVSASCVTGLAVEDTSTFFSMKGQLIIMFLAQVGGIGIVSFATFFASFMSKGVGLKHQSIIQDYLSSESLTSAKGLLRKVIIITLSIEFLGAIFIFFSWDADLKFPSLGQKIFYSAFHSVSAFCNAGFSLFSDGLYTDDFYYNSETGEEMIVNVQDMYFLHFIIAILIVFGSSGFSTLEDVFNTKQGYTHWKIGTKIAVYSSGILILLGMIGFMVLEFDQLRDRTIIEALSTSFFQSVTTRTAGFNTMDFGGLKDATIILVIFLMFIGAAPGSTGGGIKSTTFLLIALSAIANIKGQERVEIAKRTIPSDLIHKAYSIFMFATTYNLIAIFLLSITESGNEDITILQIVFEQVSAFATVGLSMGITADLSTFGKVIIIISMYIGRVGTLTLALALSSKVVTNSYRYPEGNVMVG